jgi:ornithine carbamoyltransferase
MKKTWAAYPYIGWIVIFTIVPLGLLLYFSLTVNSSSGTVFSMDNFKRFTEPIYIKVLIRSLSLAAISTGFCLLLGYPAALFLSSRDLQIGRGEPVEDTARVLARFLDGIMIRTFSHDEVLKLAEFSSVPVINGLTDLQHPCQVLADLQTVREYKGRLEGLKMVFVGDGNNMAHSLMHGGAKMGMHVVIASPEGYKPDPEMVREAMEDAKVNGGKVEVVSDPLEAVKDADVLYTDVWASMGQEDEAAKRAQAFAGFQINARSLSLAHKDAIVLHCLPAHRGEEITHEVMEGPQSAIFDEAENRLHAQKAIMALLIG